MTTALNNSYLVKLSTQGGGGSKLPKILSTWFVHNPLQSNIRFRQVLKIPISSVFRKCLKCDFRWSILGAFLENSPLRQTWRVRGALSKFSPEISGKWRVGEHSENFWRVYQSDWDSLSLLVVVVRGVVSEEHT